MPQRRLNTHVGSIDVGLRHQMTPVRRALARGITRSPASKNAAILDNAARHPG
jgi:hypothetical protein